MARRADVPTYFIEMLEGLMLICFAVRSISSGALAARARRRIETGSTIAGEPPGPLLSEGCWNRSPVDRRTAMTIDGIPCRLPHRDAGHRVCCARCRWCRLARRRVRPEGRPAQPGHRGDDALRRFLRFPRRLQDRERALGMLAGIAAGLALALLFGFLTITLRVDQVLVGLAITIFGGGSDRVSLPRPVRRPECLRECDRESRDPAASVDIPIIGERCSTGRLIFYLLGAGAGFRLAALPDEVRAEGAGGRREPVRRRCRRGECDPHPLPGALWPGSWPDSPGHSWRWPICGSSRSG